MPNIENLVIAHTKSIAEHYKQLSDLEIRLQRIEKQNQLFKQQLDSIEALFIEFNTVVNKDIGNITKNVDEINLKFAEIAAKKL